MRVYHKYMSEKVSGYLLLLIGLAIMVVSVVNMFMVFTNKAKPFSVFNISSSSSININDIISELQKKNLSASPSASNQIIAPPKLDILPPEVLNQTLNISSHFFLMSFILGFGYKLASLGVQLVRPINVKLKSHILEVMKNGAKEVPSSASIQSPPIQSTRPEPLQPERLQPT